jgi:pilus assembly protein CpaF
LIRLETLCLMNEVSLPVHVARMQVASAVHVVIQLNRLSDGSRRVQAISEVLGLAESAIASQYQLRNIYAFQASGRDDQGRIIGELKWSGEKPTFAGELLQMGHADRTDLTRHIFT